MNDFYGATAQGIQRAVDRWNHLHPGQPLPPSLYRAHLRYNKFKAPPTPGGLAVLGELQGWYEKSLSASWQVGGVSGLSNGAYRAGHVPDAIPPVDNKTFTNAPAGITGLKASVEALPGTFKMRIQGNLAPRPTPSTTRGEIKKLTRQALNRLTAFTREVEAQGFKPNQLLTLTYPGDWRGALASPQALEQIALFRRHWERLEDLRGKIKRAREALRHNRGADWVLTYLLEEFKAEKKLAKQTLYALRNLGPDGEAVKRHKNALLKRFDRAFGEVAVSVHRTYCQALEVAQRLEEQARFVAVKVRKTGRDDWAWEVVGVRYRVMWWLEFQKRGAPHLHMIFFDVREIDWKQVRAWVGHAWAAVVAGVRSAKDHDPKHNPKLQKLLDQYDCERELWGKVLADAALRQGVEALGLDWGIFQHVRAGTRLEEMRKEHWGYAAKEASKYASKKYQSNVPKNYRNVGRWWGYRKYRRVAKYWVNLPVDADNLEDIITKPLQAAAATLPPGCFRFKQKLERFLEAARNGEPYGYITVWGQAAVDAALGVLT